MSGLRRICKAYGRMTIQGVKWVWDYANDEPVKASEMPAGSERWKASGRAQCEPINKWREGREVSPATEDAAGDEAK